MIPDYTYRGPHGRDGFSVWSQPHFAAEGAGFSAVYARPSYQNRVASITHSTRRSLPDLTMDAAGGTSQAAPQFAALLALATQVRDRDLGPINAVLYDRLGRHPAANGLVDVTRGNNDGYGVRGFTARHGYDVATGWGTVDAGVFVPALAREVARTPYASSLGALAARELAVRTQAVSAAPATVDRTATSTVSGRGFLPAHPVRVSVDGEQIATVTADTRGVARYRLTGSGRTVGRHVVVLQGLLISMQTAVTIRD